MKKKALLLLASLALVTTLAVNGTLAQTLTKAIDGFFELVNGELAQRNTSELAVSLVTRDKSGTSTENNKPMLYPAHYTQQSLSPTEVEVQRSGYTYNLWNTREVNGIAEQFVSVKNIAKKDAYLLIAIAVKDDDNAKQILRSNISVPGENISVPGENEAVFTMLPPTSVTINNSQYTMQVYLYNDILVQGTESPAIAVQMAITKDAGNEQMARLGHDFLQIKVVAIDADADAFKTDGVRLGAVSALKQAIDLDNNFNPFN